MIPFFLRIQLNLYKRSNKSKRFHLKMESSEETATTVVALLNVKK